MIRVVHAGDGGIAVDLRQRSFGRGAWVHARAACLTAAAPRGFSKSFKEQIQIRPLELAHLIGGAADRRVMGLLASALRLGKLAIGADAVDRAIRSGAATHVVVAEDALSAASSTPVRDAGARGSVTSWGTKDELGAGLGRAPTGVLALLDDGFTEAVTQAVGIRRLASELVRGTED